MNVKLKKSLDFLIGCKPLDTTYGVMLWIDAGNVEY